MACAALVTCAYLVACGGEAQRTGAKDPPRAEAHRAKMNALWSPARRERLKAAVRSASKAFNDADVERLADRVAIWTDAWVLSASEADAAANDGSLSPAEVSAIRACLGVERAEYAALLDGLNRVCREPGCQAERVANLDWELIGAEQSTRACAQPAFYRAYVSTNLAHPEAVDALGYFLALEALGEDHRLGRYLTATLARHRTRSAFRTRLLLLEARRLVRRSTHPAQALALIDESLLEAEARGDELGVAALRITRSDANHQLSRQRDALKDAQLALEHTERALGADHVETALVRGSLATAMLSSTEPHPEAAAGNLDRARVTLTRALGPTHPLTARIELAQGQVAASLGDPGASQRWLTRGTSSTAVAFGAQHLAMSDAVRCNGEAESALGNGRTGIALFTRALQIDRQILGEVHPRVVTLLIRISRGYRALGRRGAALLAAERAQTLLASLPHYRRRSLAEEVCALLSAELRRPAVALPSCELAHDAAR